MNDSFGRGFLIFALMVAGALAMSGVLAMLEAVAAPEVPAIWWAARSTGLLAYVALWLSTLFGVLLAARSGKGGLLDRAVLLELHNRWSVAAVIATALHVLLVVGDPHSEVGLLAALVPLAAETLTAPIAVGVLSSWGLLMIAATTAVHRRMARWTWRAVHAGAFGTYVLALVHGWTAGTSTASPLVRAMYVGTTVVLLGALAQRLRLSANASSIATRSAEPLRRQA